MDEKVSIATKTKARRTRANKEKDAYQAELFQRCEAANITYNIETDKDGDEIISLLIPSGRDKRSITLYSTTTLKRLLDTPFEKYVFLSGYQSICSYQDGVIEALLRVATNNAFQSTVTLDRLLGRPPFSESEPNESQVDLKFSDESSGLSVRIGRPSAEISALTGTRFFNPSITISGLKVSQHDQAIDYLVRTSNALFFEIDLLLRIPLTLTRHRISLRQELKDFLRGDLNKLQFPRYEYDEAPMSLYWYGRGASGMPLLQFLAFYQVVEFYFPIYSQIEAQRRVQNILKNPTFSSSNTTDIGKILAVTNSGTGRGYGNELTQLSATVRECLDPQALWVFLTEDNSRKEALSKGKFLPKYRLPLTDKFADVREQVANRIYEIRCKVVHTKNDSGDNELDLLLPFSKEAESLGFDIEILQYVAQQVLVASSRQLQI